MDEGNLSSGFIAIDASAGAQSFTDKEEIYESELGYARLFRCSRYGRLHILKGLKPAYIGDAFYEQALRKEFEIGYRLEHPHIVRVLGWEEVPQLGYCIVLEYIDGITLRAFMEQGKLTENDAMKVLYELCDALGYLHGKQIVHRDLKPDNILITHNGRNVKLIDFGLSDSDDYEVLKFPAGTRYYLAPEVLKPEQPLDCRADIYSLGIIMGEMAEQLKSKALAAVSRKCTRKDPSERYPSAAKVAQALHSKEKGFPIGRAVVVLLLLLAMVCTVYYYMGREPRPLSLPVYGNHAAPVEQWPDSISPHPL